MVQIEDQKTQVNTYRNQWLVCLIVSLAPFTSGLANGWSSPYLAQLKSHNTDFYFQLSDYETSWVASLIYLGRAIGAILGASIQIFIGRKKTLLFSSCISILGWVCSILARTVYWLYVSRICCGLSSGVMWTSLSLFLGEVANPKIRGSLIVFNVNMSFLGLFVGNLMGPYISMDLFSYVALLPNSLFLILFSMMIPESPYHHLANKNRLKAEKSLQWFLRKSNVNDELHELEEYTQNSKLTFLERVRDFIKPEHLKSAAVLLGLNFCAFVSANNAITSYMEIIVQEMEISMDSSVAVIIISFCMIAAGFTATFLIDIVGRRRLLCFSSIGVAVSLFLIGLCFYFISINFRPVNITWFALLSLLLFVMSYNYGLGSIPTTLVGEMFPPSIKVFASLMFSSSSALCGFMVTLSFQPFNDLVGKNISYWIRGIIISVSIPFTYLAIRETKGKSLLEIQKFVTSTKITK